MMVQTGDKPKFLIRAPIRLPAFRLHQCTTRPGFPWPRRERDSEKKWPDTGPDLLLYSTDFASEPVAGPDHRASEASKMRFGSFVTP